MPKAQIPLGMTRCNTTCPVVLTCTTCQVCSKRANKKAMVIAFACTTFVFCALGVQAGNKTALTRIVGIRLFERDSL